MSDHLNMLVKSLASSRGMLPALRKGQPLHIIPTGALREATKNEIASLLQTDGVSPMSPRTVANTLANHGVLDADMLQVIAWGLIATIQDHEAKSFKEQNKYIGRINQLEDQLKKEFEKAHNDHTAPKGFEENDNHKASVSQVPNEEGDYVV